MDSGLDSVALPECKRKDLFKVEGTLAVYLSDSRLTRTKSSERNYFIPIRSDYHWDFNAVIVLIVVGAWLFLSLFWEKIWKIYCLILMSTKRSTTKSGHFGTRTRTEIIKIQIWRYSFSSCKCSWFNTVSLNANCYNIILYQCIFICLRHTEENVFTRLLSEAPMSFIVSTNTVEDDEGQFAWLSLSNFLLNWFCILPCFDVRFLKHFDRT